MTTTAQTFEEYCALHLPQRIMEAGLGVRPEENYMDVPEEPERDVTVYMVGMSEWRSPEFGFLDEESALAVINMNPIALEGDKCISNEGDKCISNERGVRIFPKKVWSHEALERQKDVLAAREKALRFNEPIRKAVEEYDKKFYAIKNVLYFEWCKEVETRRTEQRIRDTYADYCRTAKEDRTVAFEFLVKTFPQYDSDELRKIVETDEPKGKYHGKVPHEMRGWNPDEEGHG